VLPNPYISTLLPNLYIPTQYIWKIPIQPFGILVAAALVVGYMLGRRRARLTGLDPQICADGQVWIVVSGFVVAHWVSVIFYFPHRVLEEPWQLLAFWSGLSSFGGIIGAILGAVIYFKRKGVSIIKYCDAIVFGFVPAWILGRMGCTIVFDHPGLQTDFILGMELPKDVIHNGVLLYTKGTVVHNLGMYEAMLAVVLTIVIYSMKNIRPFDGFHPAVMLILYSPVRFYMDTLRVVDKTYWGMTPGQYFAILLLLFAVYLILMGLRRRRLAAAGEAEPAASSPKKKRKKKRKP
jgi:phosphatidylglycerol:prolipoprotein diacylglycerol transferase